MTDVTSQSGPTRNARWLALFGVWLVYASFGVMVASIAPMLPEIREDLGIGSTLMGFIMGSWPLVYVFAAIPAGMVLDRIGVRAGLVIAALVIALSGVLRAVAEGPMTMLFAVAIFGVGGPLVSTGAPKLIAGLFQGPSRGTAMGIYVTGPAVGGIAALSLAHPVLLPLVGDWRAVMLVFAATALAAGVIWIAVSRGVRGHSGKGAEPMSLRAVRSLMREPAIVMLLAMAVGIFYINHGLNNWLPSILRAGGMEAGQAGKWAAIPTFVGLVAAVVLPRFATPARRLPILAGLFAVAFTTSFVLLLASGTLLFAGLALQGLARGTMNTIAMLALLDRPEVPPERVGMAGGLFFSAAEIGGLLGPFSFGALLDATGGFGAALLTMAVISAAMFALTLTMGRRT